MKPTGQQSQRGAKSDVEERNRGGHGNRRETWKELEETAQEWMVRMTFLVACASCRAEKTQTFIQAGWRLCLRGRLGNGIFGSTGSAAAPLRGCRRAQCESHMLMYSLLPSPVRWVSEQMSSPKKSRCFDVESSHHRFS
ncbi:hypothetical protein ElyMa_001612100 [Elysia marginata]|uniref:Uncharacterized protein n=1 Tax=Elysia marginata TaxID=1093978 RepID=A0AAV4JHJ5_9GAST|nr:hypothetical protein ElyMa_001612100 [Elysia marginata]